MGNNLVFANAQTEKIQIFLGQGRWVATLQEVDQNKYSSTQKNSKELAEVTEYRKPIGGNITA